MWRRARAAAWAGVALLAAALGGGAAAGAAEAPAPPAPPPRPLWEAGVAVGIASLQTYAGASTRQRYWLPVPYLVYRGRWLRATGRAVRVVMYERPRFWLDLSGGGWIPVSGDDDPARAGMPRLDWTVQAGPRANYVLGRAGRTETLLRVAARAVWSASALDDISHRGYVLQPALVLRIRPPFPPRGRGKYLGSSIGLATTWGDAEHNGYFYNVAAPYATAERPEYRSGAGLIRTSLSGTLGWQLTPDLRLGLFVNLQTLAGSVVADGPLVSRRNAVNAGAGLVWVFARSERLVVGRRAGGP